MKSMHPCRVGYRVLFGRQGMVGVSERQSKRWCGLRVVKTKLPHLSSAGHQYRRRGEICQPRSVRPGPKLSVPILTMVDIQLISARLRLGLGAGGWDLCSTAGPVPMQMHRAGQRRPKLVPRARNVAHGIRWLTPEFI
jgi:hypothetical protein